MKKYLYIEIENPKRLPESDIDKLIKSRKNKYINSKSYIWRRTLHNIVLLFPIKKTVEDVHSDTIINADVKDILDLLQGNIIDYGIVNHNDIKNIIVQPDNKSKKAKASRSKGKRLENIVAEKLQQYLDLPEGTVHRSQSSGTFVYDIGDIRFNIDIPMIIECKNNESWNYVQLFTKDISKIAPFKNWLEQVCEEIDKAKKLYSDKFDNPIWFLVFTKNYEPIYVLTSEQVINILLERKTNIYLTNKPNIVLKNYDYVIYEFDELLKLIKRDR